MSIRLLTTIIILASGYALSNPAAHGADTSKRLSKYTYIMWSDKMTLKMSDDTKTVVQLTAYATRTMDTLALVVNDEIVRERKYRPGVDLFPLSYKDEDLQLTANCQPTRRVGGTFNYRCTIYSDGRELGPLNIAHRAYPSTAEESQCPANRLAEIEASVGSGDGAGHGTDIGSDEWYSVIEFQLGLKDRSDVPQRRTLAWCEYMEASI